MNLYKLFLERNNDYIDDFILLKDQKNEHLTLYISIKRECWDNVDFGVIFENGGIYDKHMPSIVSKSKINLLRRYLHERKN